MANKCNMDCFNCPYEDCIDDEITDAEREEIDNRNIRVIAMNQPVSKGTRGKKKTNTVEDNLRLRAEYYRLNREKRLEYQKQYVKRKKAQALVGEKRCSRCFKLVANDYEFSLCTICREKKRDYQRIVKETKKEKARG